MRLSKRYFYNLFVSDGSVISSGTNQTIGNVFINTTSGASFVGINTSSPNYSLDVIGNANISNNLFATTISGSNISLSENLNVAGTLTVVNITTTNLIDTNLTSGIVRVTNNLSAVGNSNTLGNLFTTGGNVGINTSNPLSTLHVNGTSLFSGNATFGSNLLVIGPALQIPTGNIANRPLGQNGNIRYNTETQQFEGYGPGGAWGSLGGVVDIAQTTKILASATPSTTDGNLYFYTTNAERMRINSSGNIGIGTSSPGTTFDVIGTGRISTSLTTGALYSTNVTTTNLVSASLSSGTLNLSSGFTSLNAQITNTISTNVSTATLNLSNGLTAGNAQITNLVATNITLSNLTATGNSNTIGNLFTTAGNIGIGIVNPSTTLHVNGNTLLSTNVTIGSNLLVIGPTLQIPTGNIATRPTVPQNGSIRYNTETQQFEGYGPGSAWGSLGGVIDIAQTTKILASATPSTTDGNLYFYTTNAERMRINSSGNIGVGTTSPSFTLDVTGTARFTNSVTTGNLKVVGLTDTLNLTATNISSNTINLSTGLTTASAQITNQNVTTSTIATLLNTNAVSTNISTATLNLSSGFTSPNAQITNSNVTISTIATLLNTNSISTNISSSTLNLSTGLTSASIQVTNLNSTNATIPTLLNTNAVSTNISSATLNLSNGLTAGNAHITNLAATNITLSNLITNNINFGISSLFSGSFLASNNVNLPSDITGFNFVNSNTRSFQATVTITIAKSLQDNLYQSYIIDGFQTNSGWSLYTSNIGDETGLEFSITSNGQIQYTSTNINNFVSNTIRYSVIQISNSGSYSSSGALTQGTLLIDSIQIQNTQNSIVGTHPGSLHVLGGSTFSKSINILTTENSIGLGSGGSLSIFGGTSISKNVYIGGNLSVTGNNNTLGPIIISGGNVGIGTNTPSFALDISGTARIPNVISTNISSATLNLSSGLTCASAQITNMNSTTATIATLLNTNQISTNISSATLNLSNGLTSASAQITNINSTTLINTNQISTNISSATLNLSSGLTSASAQISNLSCSTVNSTLMAATTITGSNLSLSGNINVAGTLTVVNITATNLMDTNLTAGIARVTTNLVAVGNSNTIGPIITIGGNVGLGTESPGEKLDVRGNLRVGGSTQGNYIAFYGTAGDGPGFYDHTYIGERVYGGGELSELLLFKGNDPVAPSGPDRIRLLATEISFDTHSGLNGTFEGVGTSGTRRLTIANNGNVGINTTSPSQVFTVSGGNILLSTGNSASRIVVQNSNTGTDIATSGLQLVHDGINGGFLCNYENNPLFFINNGNNIRMTINTSGNVGIGSSNPSNTLDVVGTARISNSVTTGGLKVTGLTDTLNLTATNSSINTLTVSGGFSASAANATIWGLQVSTNITTSGLEVTGAGRVNGNFRVNSIEMNSGGGAKRIANGSVGGGSETGTVNFPFTFSNIPSVIANIDANTGAIVFNVQISSVSTTGFTYRKTFWNFGGSYGGGAISEGLHWIAIG